jgi:hypothetical protein
LRNPWTAWLVTASLGAEAQWGITLRMILLGAGGAAALSETHRMIYEKIIANAQAQFAAGMFGCRTWYRGRSARSRQTI